MLMLCVRSYAPFVGSFTVESINEFLTGVVRNRIKTAPIYTPVRFDDSIDALVC